VAGRGKPRPRVRSDSKLSRVSPGFHQNMRYVESYLTQNGISCLTHIVSIIKNDLMGPNFSLSTLF